MRKLLIILFLLCSRILYSQNIIQNGTFAADNTGWSQSGNFYFSTLFQSYCTEIGYAYTSNSSGTAIDNASGSIWQTTQTIPSNATGGILTFYTKTGTTNTSTVIDYLTVTVEFGSSSYTVATLTNLDYSPNSCTGWQVDVSSYITARKGQNFILRFTSTQKTDGYNTVFRLDDVSLNVSTGGGNNGSCISWYNGIKPSSSIVLTASEYLCQHNIISNSQNDQDLAAMSVGEAALATISGLYNGNVPSTLPSDNFPSLVTSLQTLPFNQYQAAKALCYLEGNDGRPCINRDFFTIQFHMNVSYGQVLRMLLEGWNIAPDNSGFDIYNHTASNFLCNVLKDDANYGYLQKAYQIGLIRCKQQSNVQRNW